MGRRLQWNSQITDILRDGDVSKEKQIAICTKLSKVIEDLQNELDSIIRHQVQIAETDSSKSSLDLSEDDSASKLAANDIRLPMTVSRLTAMKRLRKITLFQKTKSIFASTDKRELRGHSVEILRENEERKQSRREKAKRMRANLPLLRKEFIILTLVDLRNATVDLQSKNVQTKSAFAWLSHPRHSITSVIGGENTKEVLKSTGRVGVTLKVGAETLDYGFEYLGIPKLSLHTPMTDRMAFNLLLAASKSKCGTVVGSSGSGKLDTVQRIANQAGQFLTVFDCGPRTPERSVRQILSGGVQGGFWVLMQQPHLLPQKILSQIVQSLISIQRTKKSSVKRKETNLSVYFNWKTPVLFTRAKYSGEQDWCLPVEIYRKTPAAIATVSRTPEPPGKECIISGQEIKLTDSFALFFSITTKVSSHDQPPGSFSDAKSRPENSQTLVSEFFQHPITPFIKTVPSTLPTIDAAIESFFMARGFILSDSFRKNIVAVLQQAVNVSTNPELTASYIRIIRLASEMAANQRYEMLQTLNQTTLKNTKSEEEIVKYSIFQILTSLVKEEHQNEWRQNFMKAFDADDENSSTETLEKIMKHENVNYEHTELKDLIIQEKSNVSPKIENIITSKLLKYILGNIIQRQRDQKRSLDKETEVRNTKLQKDISSQITEGKNDAKAIEIPQDNSFYFSEERNLMDKCIKLYSHLSVHHCTILVGPSSLKKTAIWTTLKKALNTLIMKREYLHLIFREATSCTEGMLEKYQKLGKKKLFVKSTVLYCGGYTESQLVGCCRDVNSGDWVGGVLLKIMERITKNLNVCYGSQHWLILVGPFPSSQSLDFISRFCPPNSTLKDEQFGCAHLQEGLKILLDIEDESVLQRDILKSTPVLKFHPVEVERDVFHRKVQNRLEEYGEEFLPFLSSKYTDYEAKYLSDITSHALRETTLEKVMNFLSSECHETKESYVDSFGKHLATLRSCRTGDFICDKENARHHSGKNMDTENIKGKVIIIPEEWKKTLQAIKFLLKSSVNVLLRTFEGCGLSTFLDYYECHQKERFEIFRYESSLENSTETFLSFLRETLFSFKLRTDADLTEEDYVYDVSKEEIAFAPPETKPAIIIVEGIRWSENPPGRKYLDLLETLRSILECQVIGDPSSKVPYRIKNVKFIICYIQDKFLLTQDSICDAITDIPENLLQHCLPVKLPEPSSKLLEQLLVSELEEKLTEKGDEGQMFQPLKDSILSLHELLTQNEENHNTVSALSDTEKRYLEKYKAQIAELYQENIGDNAGVGSFQVPNLKHFVRLLKSLKRYTKLLSLKAPALGSYFCNEFIRIYSSTPDDEQVIREIVEYYFTKFFEEEPDGSLVWLATITEKEGLVYNARTYYEELLKYVKSPTNFSPFLFSKDLFKELQRITFTMVENDPTRHIIMAGETGVGKLTLLHLGFASASNVMINLSDYSDVPSQLLHIREAIIHSGIKRIRTAIVIRYCDIKEEVFFVLYTLVLFGWSNSLWSKTETVGLLLSLQQPTIKQLISSGSWKNYIEDEEVTLRKRAVLKNIKQYLHIFVCATENELKTDDSAVYSLSLICQLLEKHYRNKSFRITYPYIPQVEVEEYKNLLENYPSFVRKCSTIRVSRWSFETLEELASRILDTDEFPQHTVKSVLQTLPVAFQAVQQGFITTKRNGWIFADMNVKAEEDEDAEVINLEQFQSNEVVSEGVPELTSNDFLECCRVYSCLLKKRKTQLKDELAMFKNGLTRLESTNENVEELRVELGQLEPELKNTQEEAVKLTAAIGAQRNVVAELRGQMSSHEEKVKEKSDFLSGLNDEITAEIKEAVPELESAERQIRVLDKKELVEVRVMNKPPDLIFQVMSAICLLLNVKSDWPSIKTMLGEPNMTKRLLEIDKDAINDVTLRKLRKFIEYPKFTPEEVGKLSKPCKPMCAWLRALDYYAQSLRNVEPKKARVIEAERELNNLLFEQRQLQQKLGQAERNLSEQGARYDACVCRRQQLEGAVKRAGGRLQRCTRLATVLADEHSRWSYQVKKLEKKISCVFGDCLVAAVAVAYLGHLKSGPLNLVLRLCLKLMKSCGLHVTEKNFNLLDVLCTKEEIQQWVRAGLYDDPSPLVQAAMLFVAQKPVLVVDTHQSVVPWLKKLYEPTGGLELLQPRIKNFKQKFSRVLEEGKVAVVIHTPVEAFDNDIRLVLEKSKRKDGPKPLVFFITESTKTIPSQLRVSVTAVSFAVSPRVLEEQLLNQVLERERIDLYEQKTALSASVRKDEEALQGVDLSILKRLSEAAIGLLDNEELLAAFYEAKAVAAEHRTRLAESKRSLQKISNARDKYRPVAERGRILFSTIAALGKLQKEYIFSLNYFLKLFEECIRGGAEEEMALSFDQRIASLVLTLTQKICNHVIRSIKPPHRLVFLSSLAAAVEYEAGQLTLDTWKAVIQKEVTDADRYLKKLCEEDKNMKQANDMLRQGRVLQLTLYNIQTEISLVGTTKGKTYFTPKKLSDFNALLLLRLHRPRMLLLGAKEVVKQALNDPSILDMSSSLEDLLCSKDRSVGLLLWVDYSNDIASEVLDCARKNDLHGMTRIFTAHNESGLTKKVGVSDISSAIESAVRLGGWIFIQECSSKPLLPQLLAQMTSIVSTTTKTHKNFRLIMSSRLGSVNDTDEQLILLTRPFQMVPSADFPGVLSIAAQAMNEELYINHYQGATWRKIMWLAAAVHTVVFVAESWNKRFGHTKKSARKTVTIDKETTEEFSKWIQMKDVKIAYDALYNVSLEGPLDEESTVNILENLYGYETLWSCLGKTGSAKEFDYHIKSALATQTLDNDLTNQSSESKDSIMKPKSTRRKSIADVSIFKGKKSILPDNVGVVAKEAAYRIVLTQLLADFQDLNNYIVDKEFVAFRDSFATLSDELLKEE